MIVIADNGLALILPSVARQWFPKPLICTISRPLPAHTTRVKSVFIQLNQYDTGSWAHLQTFNAMTDSGHDLLHRSTTTAQRHS